MSTIFIYYQRRIHQLFKVIHDYILMMGAVIDEESNVRKEGQGKTRH
jgi:hypothetical protein